MRSMATIGALMAAACMVLCVSACDMETNPAAFSIMGNVIPDDSCEVKAQGGAAQAFRTMGILDLSLGTEYRVFLFLSNKFEDVATLKGFEPEDGRMDTSTITVQGLEITMLIEPALVSQESVLVAMDEQGIPLTLEALTEYTAWSADRSTQFPIKRSRVSVVSVAA